MATNQNARTQTIDWTNVRERLARFAAAVEGAVHLSPERDKALMDERARTLARVPAQAPRAGEMIELATFALANERYGVERRYVREIVRLTGFTPVPGTSDFLVGVINLRGEILAVFDLRKLLGISESAFSEQSRVIVLGGEHIELGLLADAADEVSVLRADELLEPPGSVAGIGREYVRGVTKDALIVLDGDVLLKDVRLFIDQTEESIA